VRVVSLTSKIPGFERSAMLSENTTYRFARAKVDSVSSGDMGLGDSGFRGLLRVDRCHTCGAHILRRAMATHCFCIGNCGFSSVLRRGRSLNAVSTWECSRELRLPLADDRWQPKGRKHESDSLHPSSWNGQRTAFSTEMTDSGVNRQGVRS
jgi:hypothetical protein